jgi:AhpD family alkylhydroperoxidase
MLDWNTYRKQLLATIGEIGRTSPEITRGYQGLSQAGAKTGTLGAKTRELIALAVAVTRQCDGCIAVHVDAASSTERRGRRSSRLSGSQSQSTPARHWSFLHA